MNLFRSFKLMKAALAVCVTDLCHGLCSRAPPSPPDLPDSCHELFPTHTHTHTALILKTPSLTASHNTENIQQCQ
jgi:hypothetical protein